MCHSPPGNPGVNGWVSGCQIDGVTCVNVVVHLPEMLQGLNMESDTSTIGKIAQTKFFVTVTHFFFKVIDLSHLGVNLTQIVDIFAMSDISKEI